MVNLDALTYAGSLENLKHLPDPGRHTFIQGDICDRELVQKLVAANTRSIRSSILRPRRMWIALSWDPTSSSRPMSLARLLLLEAAQKYWQSTGRPEDFRFHHVSTDEVFGSLDPNDPPCQKQPVMRPILPTRPPKPASDHLVRSYGHTYGLPFTLTNCSNNYGPRQFPEKLIPLMILNALEGQPLPVYGDGQQIETGCMWKTTVKRSGLVLKDGQPGETYNIGGGNQPTNLQVVHTLCDILDELRPGSPMRHIDN